MQALCRTYSPLSVAQLETFDSFLKWSEVLRSKYKCHLDAQLQDVTS